MKDRTIYDMLIKARNEVEAAYWTNHNEMVSAMADAGVEIDINNGPLKMLADEYEYVNGEFTKRIDAEWNKINA